jgi:hypothetical protein
LRPHARRAPPNTLLVLAAAGSLGRDELLRLLYGGPDHARGRAPRGDVVESISGGNINVPLVAGIVLFSAAAIMLINLALDVLYAVIDPRIAERGRRVRSGPATRLT